MSKNMEDNVDRKSLMTMRQVDVIWIRIAFMFGILLILILLDEVLDLPYVMMGARETPVNWKEAGAEMIIVMVVGLFTLHALKRDTVRLRQAENDLLEKERKYRSMVNNIPDVTMTTDRNGKPVFISSNAQDVCGFGPEEIYDDGACLCSGWIHQDDIEVVRHRYNELFEEGIPYDAEYRVRRKDGQWIWLWDRASATYEKDGKPYCDRVISDITERKKMEHALRKVQNELEQRIDQRTADLAKANERMSKETEERKKLSNRLIELLENDRKRIAMGLHDQIGQSLTTLKMGLEMILSDMPPEDSFLKDSLTDAMDATARILRDVRDIVHELRPNALDDLGLVSALSGLLDDIRQYSDIDFHFFNRDIPTRFDGPKELAIYRITQQAINNTLIHALAKNVYVSFVRKGRCLSLSIEDDGIGFDPEESADGSNRNDSMGLQIMRERTVQVGGEFTMDSQIGKGTHLLVEIPI